MHALRRLSIRHRHRAGLLIVLSLALQLLVPAGFMPTVSHGRVALELCSGVAAMPTMAMPGMDHGRPDQDHGGHGKAAAPCSFAGIGPALGPVDAVILAAAMVFAFLLAARAVLSILPPRPARLRPPLRGPPAIA